MEKNPLPLLVLAVGMLLISFGFVYNYKKETADIWSFYFDDQTERPLQAFTQKCFYEFPAKTNSEKIVNLRHCVSIYSTFSADKKNYRVWQDPVKMMEWLAQYARKDVDVPPPMDCYYRSFSMIWLLQSLGIKAHAVVITNNADNFMDHVFVRVFNPDEDKWEIQDPLYDTEYVSGNNGRKLGMRSMLSRDIEKFKPCNFEGKCGWNLISRDGLAVSQIKTYLSAVYDTEDKILYTSRNFDEHKVRDVFGKKISFCEKKPDYCHDIIRVKEKN